MIERTQDLQPQSRLACPWPAAREGIAGIVVLNELPDLFFERHLAEQAIHAGLDVWIGELGVRWMRGFARIVRRSRIGGLCRCIRFASSRHKPDHGTGKKAVEAKVRPDTGAKRIHENSGVGSTSNSFAAQILSKARSVDRAPMTSRR
jgi:hypothetical protein